uniref:Uncharacterized protein n=1 Tax=Cyprinus carpio TaxID=7962 RepID=A0A8C1YVZ0_CYPCA
MSSYVGKSFSNQTQDASCRMHTFGNYGAHSEFHESHYAYEGLDLGGSFSSQIPSNSLKREAINTTDRARSSAAVQRTQSCSALGSRSFVSTHGYNPLSHGLLSQKAEGNMEVMEKPSGKSRTDDIKMETTSAIKQQTNSTQRQSQSQPQIYPWMTKLHMSHAREEIVNLRARRSSWLHWRAVLRGDNMLKKIHQNIMKAICGTFKNSLNIPIHPLLVSATPRLKRQNPWTGRMRRKETRGASCQLPAFQPRSTLG